MELLSYSKLDDLPEQQRAIGHLLSFFQLSDIDDAVEDVAIFLRKRYKLSLPDAIVAGTAYVHDIPLLTADKKLAKIEEIAVLEFLTT